MSYGFSALMLLLFSEIMEWKWSGFELGKLYKIHARHKAERQMDDYRACPSDREREREVWAYFNPEVSSKCYPSLGKFQ